MFVLSMAYGAATFRSRMARPAPPGTPTLRSILVDVALFSAFALHHSVAARPRVKQAISRTLGPSFERPVFVWTASALFAAACRMWRPVPGEVWEWKGRMAMALRGTQLAGFAITAWSATSLGPLELAGIPGTASGAGGESGRSVKTRGPYSMVRHPIYTGWMLMVFGTPRMTATRLVFAATSTAYLLLAMPLEERALLEMPGSPYARYLDEVRSRIVPGVY
ncbi:MAG: isoprenylcysteine carboxylmethyltransferase family protein [Acidobacteria bacterium]|nr:MAG: isoprenylcysteine carboxylmethyltransferase family protein [Acidobacteriota bacterium]